MADSYHLEKLAPYGTDDRLFATDGPCQLQSHVTQKNEAKCQKSGPIKFRYCARKDGRTFETGFLRSTLVEEST